jgi:putative flippase GtrA
MPRFALVGIMNATLDMLVLNGLLWLFPTTRTLLILLYTIIAYGFGAANSFFLNKYWTFQHRQRTTSKELLRFGMTVLFGLGWSMLCIWLASTIAHPFITNITIWTNLSKVIAIGSAAFLSFLAMRLWIFVKPSSMIPS